MRILKEPAKKDAFRGAWILNKHKTSVHLVMFSSLAKRTQFVGTMPTKEKSFPPVLEFSFFHGTAIVLHFALAFQSVPLMFSSSHRMGFSCSDIVCRIFMLDLQKAWKGKHGFWCATPYCNEIIFLFTLLVHSSEFASEVAVSAISARTSAFAVHWENISSLS